MPSRSRSLGMSLIWNRVFVDRPILRLRHICQSSPWLLIKTLQINEMTMTRRLRMKITIVHIMIRSKLDLSLIFIGETPYKIDSSSNFSEFCLNFLWFWRFFLENAVSAMSLKFLSLINLADEAEECPDEITESVYRCYRLLIRGWSKQLSEKTLITKKWLGMYLTVGIFWPIFWPFALKSVCVACVT